MIRGCWQRTNNAAVMVELGIHALKMGERREKADVTLQATGNGRQETGNNYRKRSKVKIDSEGGKAY